MNQPPNYNPPNETQAQNQYIPPSYPTTNPQNPYPSLDQSSTTPPPNETIPNVITTNIINNAKNDIKKSFLDRFKCDISILKVYFDIETLEIRDRLLSSLNPINKTFIQLVEKKPDLYGPFWIYTTLIFVIAASGSITKYLNGLTNHDYFQEYLPVAAGIIYGIGFCLPFIVGLLMKFFGSETSFGLIICIYGYSFTIYIPIMILCIFFKKIQVLLVAVAVACSTVFLIVNFLRELNKYVDNRKYFVLGVIIIFQICLYVVIKVKFFKAVSKVDNE